MRGRLIARLLSTSVALVVAWHTTTGPASAAEESIVPNELSDRALTGPVRVIVELELPGGLAPEGHLPDAARVSLQRRDIAAATSRVLDRLRPHQHRVVHRYATVPLLALEVGSPAIQELAAARFLVRRVVEDEVRQPVLAQSVPVIGADRAWSAGFDGRGTVVAVIDTGVDAGHPFLAGKVIEEACYSSTVAGRSTTLCPNGLDEQLGPGAAQECSVNSTCFHGTHVSGIAAGNGTLAGVSFSGVAPAARIMAVQVFSRFDGFFDCGGFPPCIGAFTSDYIAGMERVYLRRAAYTFASVNLSLGGGRYTSPCDGDPTKPIMDNLRSVGIATVAAAGNDGETNAMTSPGCVPTAISVGATTKDDEVASFSNVTSFMSLFAPGEEITSSIPGGGFAAASGTSMATPHVAGTWAILKQAAPSRSVEEVLGALQATGVPISDTRFGGTVTGRRIQVDAALEILVSGEPGIGSVSPNAALPGASLSVAIRGVNFQPGATASFGSGVTVTSTYISSTELSAAIVIETGAPPGAHSVIVTNPDGRSAIRVAGFTVIPPPARLSLAYLGMLRDRVSRSNTSLAADGFLDGVFQMTLEAGSSPRTVTRLDLTRSGTTNLWDTSPGTSAWILGVSASLDSALLNSSTGALDTALADGGSLSIFAADLSTSSAFVGGAMFVLTAKFADGTSASASVTLPAIPSISSLSPSTGGQGTSLTVTIAGSNFQSGATVSFGTGVSVTSTTVTSATKLSVAVVVAASAALGARDVTVTNPDGRTGTRPAGFTVSPAPPRLSLAYVGMLRDRVSRSNTSLAADGLLDGVFLMTLEPGSNPRTVTRLDLTRSGTTNLWDTNPGTSAWILGVSASLDSALLNSSTGAIETALADGASVSIFAADLSTSAFVGGANFVLTAQFADGTSASASVTLPAIPSISSVSPSAGGQGNSLTVTIAGSNFQSGATVSFGSGVTVTSTTVTSTTRISVAIVIAATATLGTRDVTVTNLDGRTATRNAAFTVSPAPPRLTLTYVGMLRDRVSRSNTILGPDGALDGAFQLALEPGSNSRTVTRLDLRRSGTTNLWDTNPGTAAWIIGVSASLDSVLLNSSTGAIETALADGSSLSIFAANPSPSAFVGGAVFVLTVQFADGTSASASVTIQP